MFIKNLIKFSFVNLFLYIITFCNRKINIILKFFFTFVFSITHHKNYIYILNTTLL